MHYLNMFDLIGHSTVLNVQITAKGSLKIKGGKKHSEVFLLISFNWKQYITVHLSASCLVLKGTAA